MCRCVCMLFIHKMGTVVSVCICLLSALISRWIGQASHQWHACFSVHALCLVHSPGCVARALQVAESVARALQVVVPASPCSISCRVQWLLLPLNPAFNPQMCCCWQRQWFCKVLPEHASDHAAKFCGAVHNMVGGGWVTSMFVACGLQWAGTMGCSCLAPEHIASAGGFRGKQAALVLQYCSSSGIILLHQRVAGAVSSCFFGC
jgi:hypothetical protein